MKYIFRTSFNLSSYNFPSFILLHLALGTLHVSSVTDKATICTCVARKEMSKQYPFYLLQKEMLPKLCKIPGFAKTNINKWFDRIDFAWERWRSD